MPFPRPPVEPLTKGDRIFIAVLAGLTVFGIGAALIEVALSAWRFLSG